MENDILEFVSFHLEDIHHPFEGQEEDYRNWIKSVVSEENKTISALIYVFCSDEYLLDVNIQYLNHDYYTDIITFPYKEGLEIEGDMYVSVDRVKENAQEYHVSFENELRRVMVHGVLHLLGYSDKSDENIAEMRAKEDYYIEKFETTKGL